MICYKYNKPIRTTVFNYNKWVTELDIERISFYCNNLDLLSPKPKFTFRHLKKGIQEFDRRFVLAPADKAANNVVVV